MDDVAARGRDHRGVNEGVHHALDELRPKRSRAVLRRLLIRIVILAVAIALTVWLVPDIDVDGGFGAHLWVACIFGFVNGIIGPFVRLIALPITLMTLGLFALVVNAALLALTAGLSDA